MSDKQSKRETILPAEKLTEDEEDELAQMPARPRMPF